MASLNIFRPAAAAFGGGGFGGDGFGGGGFGGEGFGGGDDVAGRAACTDSTLAESSSLSSSEDSFFFAAGVAAGLAGAFFGFSSESESSCEGGGAV